MAKKIKPSLWKLSIALGVLLGIGIKVWDYINAGYVRCGVFSPAQQCSGFFQYIKELPVWVILGVIVAFVSISGGKYVIAHAFHSAKNFKMPEFEFVDEDEPKKKEVKEEKELKKEEPKEEIKEEKKVLKI